MKKPAKSRTTRTKNAEVAAKSPPPVPHAAKEADARQIVLVAVLGQSPAVLTETVWALAREEPALIPHRVVVITTTQGREAVMRELLTPKDNCVWNQMCEALQSMGHNLKGRLQFGETPNDIRVITRFDPVQGRTIELSDITNEEENLAAADFIMEQVRGLAADDVRLVASIAGGRKTMGALLFAAMSLIGRPDDLLTHVLVNPPFDSPGLHPRFYFPVTPPVSHTLKDPRGNPVKDPQGNPVTARSDEAKILLGRIPFVALRTLFEGAVINSPTYSVLVQRCQVRSEHYARMNVRLKIYRSGTLIEVNGIEIKTTVKQHLFLLFLAELAKKREQPWTEYWKAVKEFNKFAQRIKSAASETDLSDWRYDVEKEPLTEKQFERFCVRAKNELKEKLERAGPQATLLYHLLPARGRFSLNLPPEQITIVD